MQKTKKLSLGEKLWLRTNRKPGGKMTVYLAQHAPWILIGLLLLMDVSIVTATVLAELAIWFPVLFIIYTIFVAVVIIHIDRKHGYIDAIHEHYLKRREARMTELLGDNPEPKS